jgi:polar amino acid transport system substrate-binding protein
MSKTRLWTVLVLIIGLVAASVAAGCGSDDDDSGDDGATTEASSEELGLIEDGTLIAASDIPYPPFEQGDPPDYEGFDIDLINAIGEEMGLEVRIERQPFDVLLQGRGGQYDVAIAATTITPARERRVDFSNPYFKAAQGLLVRTDSEIATFEDLSGATVGAQDGTTGETYANDETEAGEVRGFPQIDDAYQALESEQVEAVVNDLPSVRDVANDSNGRLEVADHVETDELYGIIVPQGNEALVDAINEALQEVKDSGRLNEIYEEWIGVSAPASLLEATHEPS